MKINPNDAYNILTSKYNPMKISLLNLSRKYL